jgi:hypothetical protein
MLIIKVLQKEREKRHWRAGWFLGMGCNRESLVHINKEYKINLHNLEN